MSNTIKTKEGIEIYEDEIYTLADTYIANLKAKGKYNDDDIKKIMCKPHSFKGMLKYIYKHLFKASKKDKKYNNKNSNIDYSDIDLLNNIWDIYTDLCYTYMQNPTLLNFSMLTGIDITTFNSWKNKEYRAGESKETSASHSQSVKNWLSECESALVDTAMTGNPGPMFLLKANYGYREAPQQIEVTNGQLPDQTAADIAARHKLSDQGKEMPQLPDDL